MSNTLLRLYNSLTRSKDVFIPNVGNHVKFYICGPTVYDSAHMGHARAYISFDIVRRVLASYFNYDVLYIMNITDIDDKIIKRARQNHLYDAFKRDPHALNKVINDVTSALTWYEAKCAAETDVDKKNMMVGQIERLKSALTASETTSNGTTTTIAASAPKSEEDKKHELLVSAKDVLGEWLDSVQGHTITDLGVFTDWAKKFETEFFDEMRELNVKTPDVVTRVSEYVPEIETFIQQVIDNGYAYITSDKSIYFDTEAFSLKHKYAKLVPEAYADKDNIKKHLREGEGELSIGQDKASEKRSPTDFALWKSSKAGEPFWDSRWGRGRPGWHVECSVMSTEVCGDTLDIHAGGFDLRFPHHDNEIAQCEAFYDYDQWVANFLHCGTLRIEGLKMSKSLKNFITIRDALKSYTSRQLRLLFLMHNWADCLDYSSKTMERALQFERFSNEFLFTVKDLQKQHKTHQREEYQKYQKHDLTLLNTFTAAKETVHAALCDSIDTRSVIEKLREVIVAANIYVKERSVAKEAPHIHLLQSIADYITHLFRVFGALPDTATGHGEMSNGVTSEMGREELLMPYLETLADFRQNVRNMAREAKNIDILKECDRLRDEALVPLGVRIEDATEHSRVKLVDPEVLQREQQQKLDIAEAKRLDKEKKAQDRARAIELKAQRAAASKQPPKNKKQQRPQEEAVAVNE